jgi:hypothetical protein
MKIFKIALVATFGTMSAAVCTSNVSIDDFSQWSSNLNTLGGWTSDDGTMASISASGGKLSFTPETDDSSYFYTTFDCITAPDAPGSAAVSFPIESPTGGSFMLEIQASPGCASNYTSRFVTVSDLPVGGKTVTVGLNAGETVKSFVWQGFTQGSWELGEIQMVCTAGSGTSSSRTTSTLSPTTSTTVIPIASSTGTCTTLLIDDWESQSRLTFLYYNAMLEVSGRCE